jgi:ABC-2 type transport system permease protein
MEQLYGKEQIRRFLKYELDRYLRARGGEVVEELPLARVENQPYIHYQKGIAGALWLKEVVGEAVVNRRWQRCCRDTPSSARALPQCADFLRHPARRSRPEARRADHRPVRAHHAARRSRPRGARHEARRPMGPGLADIEARKLYADGKGHETEAPLDEPFEVGAFSDEPGKPGFKPVSVLRCSAAASWAPRRSGLVVDGEPRWAGVDPYNKRIDRNRDDNLAPVLRQ